MKIKNRLLVLMSCIGVACAPVSKIGINAKQTVELNASINISRVAISDRWRDTSSLEAFIEGKNPPFGVADMHAATVSLLTLIEDGNKLEHCNGTYIGGGYILTAKHCVNMKKTGDNVFARMHKDAMFPKVEFFSTETDLALLHDDFMQQGAIYADSGKSEIVEIDAETERRNSHRDIKMNLFKGEVKIGDKVKYYPVPLTTKHAEKLKILFPSNFSFDLRAGNFVSYGNIKTEGYLGREKYYFVDCPSMQGFSGSGVFLPKENGTLDFAGVVIKGSMSGEMAFADLAFVIGNSALFLGNKTIKRFLRQYIDFAKEHEIAGSKYEGATNGKQ